MEKTITAILLILISLSTYSQDYSISVNMDNRPEPLFFGVGVQGMIRLNDKLQLSPNITYYFKNEDTYENINQKYSTLNYNVDLHYRVELANGHIISPFVGIGGMTIFYNYTPNFENMELTPVLPPPGTVKHIDSNDFELPVSIGVRGEWAIWENVFINTQAKYSFLTIDRYLDDFFTLTAGVGYKF